MKKFIKSSLFLAFISAIGYFVFKFSTKFKELKGKYDTCIFFKGKNVKCEGEEFKGGSYAVMFSGLELDLTGAILEEDATLEIYGECCGISIKVPSDWQVQAEGSTEKSGFSNSTSYDEEDVFKPVLKINYQIRCSGMEIKYV